MDESRKLKRKFDIRQNLLEDTVRRTREAYNKAQQALDRHNKRQHIQHVITASCDGGVIETIDGVKIS